MTNQTPDAAREADKKRIAEYVESLIAPDGGLWEACAPKMYVTGPFSGFNPEYQLHIRTFACVLVGMAEAHARYNAAAAQDRERLDWLEANKADAHFGIDEHANLWGIYTPPYDTGHGYATTLRAAIDAAMNAANAAGATDGK